MHYKAKTNNVGLTVKKEWLFVYLIAFVNKEFFLYHVSGCGS